MKPLFRKNDSGLKQFWAVLAWSGVVLTIAVALLAVAIIVLG